MEKRRNIQLLKKLVFFILVFALCIPYIGVVPQKAKAVVSAGGELTSATGVEVNRERAEFDEPEAGIDGPVNISASESTKWTVESSADWIKVSSDGWTYGDEYTSIEGTGNGKFYIRVKENDTYEDREGDITISSPGLESYTIHVWQVENEKPYYPYHSIFSEISIKISKKTFDRGKTTKIKLDYPDYLYASDIKSIKLSTTNRKVATIDKKGTIKGIKKGTAIIKVKIILEAGLSGTAKAKITVGKRKVKLSKFKWIE